MKLQRHHTKYLFYIIIGGFFLFIISSIFIYSNDVFADEENKAENLSKNSQLPHVKNQLEIDAKKESIKETILAKAYVIYDINNKKIVMSGNAKTVLPIASLTKIITVGTLLDTAKKNNIEIREDTKLKIKKALIESSNKEADNLGYIYQNSFGRDLLTDSNILIESLGIRDLKITNLTGLDNSDKTASNVGSPESIAKVFAFMYENYRDVFEYTKFEEVETVDGVLKNTNKGTSNTFGIMASKTGFTIEAGGNLGVIISPEPGTSYVIVVMQSTKEGRFTDVEKIANLLPLIVKN